MDQNPNEIATELGHQVQRWYTGGKKKRDEIVQKLRNIGQDDIADDITRWFEMGNKRFEPLIKRLLEFKL